MMVLNQFSKQISFKFRFSIFLDKFNKFSYHFLLIFIHYQRDYFKYLKQAVTFLKKVLSPGGHTHAQSYNTKIIIYSSCAMN